MKKNRMQINEKIIYILLACCMLLGHSTALAEERYAERSEIEAYIDYAPVDAYIIDGYTYVSVTDLSCYGFDVSYSEATDSYNISRIKFNYPQITRELWEKRLSERHTQKIVDSDTRVYLDGAEQECFKLDNGDTLIMIDSLSKYGEFKWDGTKVDATIFKHELENELETAENVVETEFEKSLYRGQTNSEGKPDGIGIISPKSYSLDTITQLGYFKDGKPDGLTYKEWSRSVTKTYKYRRSYFIGTVDGSKMAPVRQELWMGEIPYKVPDGANFGSILIPLHFVPEWTGPDWHIDTNLYMDGFYAEEWTEMIISSGTGVYIRSYIGKHGDIQTAEYSTSDESPGYTQPHILKSANEFYEYTDGVKTYYNKSICTVGKDENDRIVLNRVSDGGGFHPVISVVVNGEEVRFDVDPVIEDERTLAPMRAIFEKLGANVSWNEDTRSATASLNGTSITFAIDDTTAYINGAAAEMDVPARLINDRTMVPLRFLSENLGYNVDWNGDTHTVTIEN